MIWGKKTVKGVIARDSYLIMALNSNDLHLLQIFVMAGFFVAACVGFVLALKRDVVWARHPLVFKAGLLQNDGLNQ